MDNFFKEPSTGDSPEDKMAKSERTVTLSLENLIEDLSKKPQTNETVKEIFKYQAKLAEHLNKLDVKYAVEKPKEVTGTKNDEIHDFAHEGKQRVGPDLKKAFN